MLGPGEGVGGGIWTLVETIVPFLRQRVDLLYLPTVRHRSLKESGKISLRNVALTVSQYTRFLWALHHLRPDIIHIHTSKGIAWLKDTFFILAAKAYGRRVVLHMHGGNFGELHDRNTRFVQSYTGKALRLSDAVILVSAAMKRRIARIIPNERAIILRNCIAVDDISSHLFNRSSNGTTALFLGVIGASKGVFDLLQCMSYLKLNNISIHLWVGGGEEREGDLRRAQARLEELHLEDTCQLVGEVRGEKKARLLREANLFVLPSYHEGLPMAILEAMAAGLAVVSTPVGGIPEVIADGYNGFLITPGDVGALTDRLTMLANNPTLRRVMGWRSREMAVRELDVKAYVDRLVAIYELVNRS